MLGKRATIREAGIKHSRFGEASAGRVHCADLDPAAIPKLEVKTVKEKGGGFMNAGNLFAQPDMPEEALSSSQEQRLLLQQGLAEEILEAAPDAMVIVNSAGKMILVNAQALRLFHYTRAELLGQFVELLVPERLGTQHLDYRVGYFADPHRRPMGSGRELFGRRKGGHEFPVEISLSPLITDAGQLVVSTIRDVSEKL
jgi:PAS domain S-box-containing protein